MQRVQSLLFVPCLAAMLLALPACNSDTAGNGDDPVEMSGPPPALPGGADAHHDEGPHGGHIIELGRNHKYHAELVEDDANETVTVYILDTNMKELPIDAASVSLSLTAAGETTSFELTAVAADDAAGSSRFESSDKKLFAALERGEEVTGKLRATIDGTPYVGNVEHHEHDK